MIPLITLIAAMIILCWGLPMRAAESEPEQPLMSAATFAGLELRSIGPALMSGRIADIALDPEDPSTWYVAVGSGGVWKTENAGTTWTPIFDDESSYSIGCVTVDPTDPNVVWVGTGENVGGRHVGFGDGVYRSDDRGTSWTRTGLEGSEHISEILVDPRDSNVIWVAAQGPLWSAGGDRGLFRSLDRGETWAKVLGDDRWTGVTDVVMDPRDSDTLYAATWQHQRSVAAYMGGGPESGIYRTVDGGETWERLTNGLPEEDIGKIGLAISPQQPDVVYADIELARRSGGLWRSPDRGASWEKRSDTVSGGTGPHYYQELVASPHAFDRLYLMDVRIQVSEDGGTSFRTMTEDDKHSDNHALAFRPDDPGWLLAGTDGGLYESFDLGASWRYIANLPVTQFYKIALNEEVPFYTVYGGTQDNSTQAGPVRTDSANGIRNADWRITLFADGHQPATEPGNPDIVYCEWQNGNLVRHDRTSGENVHIQPQPEPGDPPERFNWDAPILVSPHSPTRLYYASQRLWRSDDRGDSWSPVSPDLTHGQDRMMLPLMGRHWGWDSAWDMVAMSRFGTITSIAESPASEGLLWVGTDDGLIQVSEDGGTSWRAIEVGSLPGVPDEAFVNDIKADLHRPGTVYVALDNHKHGDLAPYLYRSDDRGRTWQSMVGDLPDRHLVWRVVQDHERPDLLFAGTELGLFFTVDAGAHWIELTGGVPTISFRDLAIQRDENDLVGASFGRGIFVLDDYTPLRQVSAETLASQAVLFEPRPAWWYVERDTLGETGRASQGASYFVAENPPFGAALTYYLHDDLLTLAKQRQQREKELAENGTFATRPGWDELEAERRERDPQILLIIRDADGSVVRRLEGPTGKGIHRVAWDLRMPASDAVGFQDPDAEEEDEEPRGFLVAPGRYTATLVRQQRGEVTQLAGPVTIQVERLRNGALEGSEPAEVAAFWRHLEKVQRAFSGARAALELGQARIEALRTALSRSGVAPAKADVELDQIAADLHEIDRRLIGTRSRRSVGEPMAPAVAQRLSIAITGTRASTYGPTPTHRRSLELAEQELTSAASDLARLLDERLARLEATLEAAGVPWTPGRKVPAVRLPSG